MPAVIYAFLGTLSSLFRSRLSYTLPLRLGRSKDSGRRRVEEHLRDRP